MPTRPVLWIAIIALLATSTRAMIYVDRGACHDCSFDASVFQPELVQILPPAILPNIDIFVYGTAADASGAFQRNFVLPDTFQDGPFSLRTTYRMAVQRDYVCAEPMSVAECLISYVDVLQRGG